MSPRLTLAGSAGRSAGPLCCVSSMTTSGWRGCISEGIFSWRVYMNWTRENCRMCVTWLQT